MSDKKVVSSFRDPSGFLFRKDGVLYRQINHRYKDDYDFFINSGLYKCLTEKKLLIPHQEVSFGDLHNAEVYKFIKPEIVPFVSYPYEWSFSQLKSAALVTLEIQKIALSFKMTLKDASAYNIQFNQGRPILIDTLSFERYREGMPWVAYRQFCEHFISPLALMSNRDIRLNQLFRVYLEGIPLDLTSKLLPLRTKFQSGLLIHIHLHAKSRSFFQNKYISTKECELGYEASMKLLDHLRLTLNQIKWSPRGTEWSNYYDQTNYTGVAFESKKRIVSEFLDKVKSKNLWDLGANTGIFSRLASAKGIWTLSCDIDPAAVEKNYLQSKINNETNTLPLVIDVINPSPGIGWGNAERIAFIERGPAETVMALALLHHLAISNNLPFENIANFFSRITNSLIIEFIPKDDSQVQRLLLNREDIFPKYSEQDFENDFGAYFSVIAKSRIEDSDRIIYLMQKKG